MRTIAIAVGAELVVVIFIIISAAVLVNLGATVAELFE